MSAEGIFLSLRRLSQRPQQRRLAGPRHAKEHDAQRIRGQGPGVRHQEVRSQKSGYELWGRGRGQESEGGSGGRNPDP